MNRKFLEAIRIIFTIITIILAIATIIMILMKLLGYSPTETTIMLSVMGMLATLQAIIITALFQIKGDVGSLKEFQRQTVDKIKQIENKI